MLFKKILIANRGEIAVRIIRACYESGIKSLAIYSDDDKKSIFYRLADEAVHLKGTGAADTYLNIPRVIEIAKETGCDAIHPGYGFLSENSDFVSACESEGLKFIGPSSATMKKVSDKAHVKKIMETVGIPVLPSIAIEGEVDFDRIRTFVSQADFPLIVKPSFGGGGKGMKVIYSETEVDDAVRFAQNIGRSAFGNNAFYIEKCLRNPRHIEVQILADNYGGIVDLGERDCSIQRNHQKILEESPSPALNKESRNKIAELARKAAAAVDYENAGTVEFLYENGQFYFIEINARIQVEHPVTELTTGIDLIKGQIRIASGERIKMKKGVSPRGAAIECRINAEDPFNNFSPCPGQIKGYRSPGGIGVRVDSGVFMGFMIPPQYDSLVSKLSVWGRNRGEAVSRMRRALNEYVIIGIKTTLPLHRAIFREASFKKGDYDTSYIEKKLEILNGIMQQIRETEKSHDELLASLFQNNNHPLAICDANIELEDFMVFK
ncbi:MAG: acetyl-CoA carboxylase biotin carboxylase subunit [bacterium]